MTAQRRIGFVYNQRVPVAIDLVKRLIERLELGDGAWVRSTSDLEQASDGDSGVELLITVGGDGTILRAAHFAAPHGIPILGVNMGRLGFMTELRASEALTSIATYMGDEARVEERAMIQARILRPTDGEGEAESLGPYHALNDVVVGSGGGSRMVSIEVAVDGTLLTEYHADAVIVATATGSTGYALSVGGPILYPLSQDMLVNSVAGHLGLENALVLPRDSRVELAVESARSANLYIDGFVGRTLEGGARVTVEASPYWTLFLRKHPPEHYYATLTQRLGLGRDVSSPFQMP